MCKWIEAGTAQEISQIDWYAGSWGRLLPSIGCLLRRYARRKSLWFASCRLTPAHLRRLCIKMILMFLYHYRSVHPSLYITILTLPFVALLLFSQAAALAPSNILFIVHKRYRARWAKGYQFVDSGAPPPTPKSQSHLPAPYWKSHRSLWGFQQTTSSPSRQARLHDQYTSQV